MRESYLFEQYTHRSDVVIFQSPSMDSLAAIVASFTEEIELLRWALESGQTAHPIVLNRLRELRSMSRNSTLSSSVPCRYCQKVFSKTANLNRHIKTVHSSVKHMCTKCDKTFTRKDNMDKHTCSQQTRYHREFRCKWCPLTVSTPRELVRHHFTHQHASNGEHSTSTAASSTPSSRRTQTPPRPSTSTSTVTCRTCKNIFPNRRCLFEHQMQQGHRAINQVGGEEAALQQRPWGEGLPPWEETGGHISDVDLQREYELNIPHILAPHNEGAVLSTFNFPISNAITIGELIDRVESIFSNQQRAFRINLAFGVILRNVETGRYRYFHPYSNDPIFQRPLYITNRSDLDRLSQALETIDILPRLVTNRPDTRWKPILITNVNFYIYLSDFPLGHTPSPLPDYIKNHKAIISLDMNDKNGRFYRDNLCAFRCLALHRDRSALGRLENTTRRLYLQWVVYCRDNNIADLNNVSPRDYPGLILSHIPYFENCFKLNISIYSLDKLKVANAIFKSRARFDDDMALNLHEAHLSYITNINLYCHRYQCSCCEKLFKTQYKVTRHQRTCKGQTSMRFPSGFHQINKTIFEELEEYNICVDNCNRHFPWFIVYDFEALLLKLDANEPSNKLVWSQEHKAISVSVCCNVVEYDKPHCIVNADSEQLLSDMFDYMSLIRSTIQGLAEERWGDALSSLKDQLEVLGPPPDNITGGTSKVKNSTDLLRKQLSRLYGKLKGYCSQIPVLGFNSGRYDMNLIKRGVARHLSMHDSESQTFTVKKNNSYLCMSNDEFKFLDITQYLAPGTSYVQFIKAYGVDECKGFFPYEYLDSPGKLEDTRLPPLGEAWYSSLKQKSVLDDGLKSPSENYAWLEEQWKRENMKTLRDFLEWYNNLDVGPFVQAVSRLQDFYFEENIDVFKTTMSVPGIARHKLFRSSKECGVTFALFDKQNADLYETIKQNVVGGPSLIFTRYHKANRTFIRENPHKPCRRLVGYDANALYLWAIGQKMPTGCFVRRRSVNGFKPEVRDKYMDMYHWMDWLKATEGKNILHKLNWGHEKRIGPFMVDGYIPETRTILSYHGCYFHGHCCHLTIGARKKDKTRKLLEKRAQRTLMRRAFFKKSGYRVHEMLECQFKRLCNNTITLREFIASRRPAFYQKNKGVVSQQQILRAVQNDNLFGIVEIDICVPDQWPMGKIPHNTLLTPRQYFEEMSPLFCNSDVPFEAMGDHMQEYIRSHNLSDKPRRLLIGGMRARRILIATPLLKWYIQHGMSIDRVYQVVEYTPVACFKTFVEQVSTARRESDNDPSMAIRGDTMKLTGNSAFGSLLINKEKHQTIAYVQGQVAACKQVNEPQFRKLTDLGRDYFEVEKAKKSIKLDMPIQLGYFILQYAKLRMLQFYYDFMDVFVERSDYEYCEMDTDSAYMALSSPRLDDIIKPHLYHVYEHGLKGFCRGSISADAVNHWFPRACCDTHRLYDRRTPGLFKLEFQGDELIGLCSKTYLVCDSRLVNFTQPSLSSLVLTAHRLSRLARGIVSRKRTALLKKPCTVGKLESTIKFSCKGISKRTIKSPLSAYRQVLRSRQSGSGMNRGFRARDNTVFTYEQTRDGLSYFYCKRKVLADGIHTAPLDIELCPWPQRNINLDETDTFLVDLLLSNSDN